MLPVKSGKSSVQHKILKENDRILWKAIDE